VGEDDNFYFHGEKEILSLLMKRGVVEDKYLDLIHLKISKNMTQKSRRLGSREFRFYSWIRPL